MAAKNHTKPINTARRTFLATLGTALPAVSQAVAPAPKPTSLIDCQSHLYCPELLGIMEKRDPDPVVFTRYGTRFLRMGDWLRKVPPQYLDVAAKLAAMDAAGIIMPGSSKRRQSRTGAQPSVIIPSKPPDRGGDGRLRDVHGRCEADAGARYDVRRGDYPCRP